MGSGDPDEDLGGHALHGGEQTLAAHARVGEHGHGAELEDGVGDRDQVGAGAHEEAHAHALLHALCSEPGRDPIGALLELGIGEDVPPAPPRPGGDHGRGLGVLGRARREERGDVHLVRHATEGSERVSGAFGHAR